jgi:hypothetical protein
MVRPTRAGTIWDLWITRISSRRKPARGSEAFEEEGGSLGSGCWRRPSLRTRQAMRKGRGSRKDQGTKQPKLRKRVRLEQRPPSWTQDSIFAPCVPRTALYCRHLSKGSVPLRPGRAGPLLRGSHMGRASRTFKLCLSPAGMDLLIDAHCHLNRCTRKLAMGRDAPCRSRLSRNGA